MSKYDPWSFQFISLDGTRSAFDSSDIDEEYEWTDHIVPQGKQIRTVETFLSKYSGFVYGFKWIGDDGAVLVVAGDIDSPSMRKDPRFVLKSLTLNHNQRLVGVKSCSGGLKWARHS